MSDPSPSKHPLWKLTLGALGVCYGDIGTSPLYALRESLHGHGVHATPENVYGVLSLIVWTLLIVVTLKYMAFVLRADNQGEGGILALMALVEPPGRSKKGTVGWGLVMTALFGAALLYGDGVLTPAISVLSAVEGLQLVLPGVSHWVVPITVGILIGLFWFQHRGSAAVGALFGPITVVWFLVLGVLGIRGILMHPEVLQAVAPWHGIRFLATHGWEAFLVLGSVFLVCTGAESLYADMGHFGRKPIRLAWFTLVLPALLLNYFGQGALYLSMPDAHNPFFQLAPPVLLLPLVVLATLAAVIASQALISGVYSLTQQAVQLGYSPRLNIRHTSAREMGQIYVASVNWALLAGTIAVVVGFGSSSALASAYGIAIATTMVITTVLATVLARRVWRWGVPVVVATWGVFLVIELGFFSANLTKIVGGGWLPIVFGLGVFTLMTTWRTGRQILSRRLRSQSVPFEAFFELARDLTPYRVPRTAVFMTRDTERVPPALYRNLVHNRVLHERIVLLKVRTQPVPHVPDSERLTGEQVAPDFWRVVLHFGFMEVPDVPRALQACRSKLGLDLSPDEVSYFLGRETLLPTDGSGMALWREHLFALLSRNAQRATTYFHIPPAAVVEMGAQIEI